MTSLSALVDDWLESVADDPKEVRAFCESHDISTHLKIAIERVNERFAMCLRHVTIQIVKDYDEDREWVVIDVMAVGNVDGVLTAYDACIADWVASIPSEKLSLIRLTFDIV